LSDNEPGIEEELLSVWQRLTLSQLRWILLAMILVITAASGGLQTARYAEPVAFGEAYDDGPLLITAHSISLADQRAGLIHLSRECRYLVLAATIHSTARDSVPFLFPGNLDGKADDCAPHEGRDDGVFEIVGIAGQFAAILRGHESIAVPTIEPGFTNDYSVVFVVPDAELRRHAQLSIRFHNMSQYVSTFGISRGWIGDPTHYGELQIPDLEPS
jgi:hypothetical protein